MVEKGALGFADRVLFEDVDLRIGEADRIGLIGPNGSGKTTLLRVLAAEQQLDDGTIERRKGLRVGYLSQDIEVASGQSLRDFVMSSVPGRTELDVELAEVEAELADTTGKPENLLLDLAERVAELHARIDHFDQFFTEHEAMGILAGLGFQPSDRDRDLGEFSGGWRMRAALGALLFQQPDLLLLDEPTNHLDMPSVAWFSDFLRRYQRAFMLISHDREFLNEQIQRVVSFELEGVRQYTGNVEQYDKQRAEEAEILANKAKNIARQKEQMQRFVDRFRAQANKAKAVQSRVKALDKLDDVELFGNRKTMRFRFPPCERAASEVVRVEGLKKAYGDLVVLDGLDLSVRRGEKIALIGPNGAGKTTLLKIMAGELDHEGGKVALGGKVKCGYYAQHHADTLHNDSTVYDEAANANPQALPARVRSVLGAFLFSGDDIDKKVSVLSGGERARLALARLMINPGNLLLMDEPTNHLDMASSESLAESLADYDGTVVFVSHNRSLIRRLATRIWNIEAGAVETYDGTLDEYMYSVRLRLEGKEPDAVAGTTSPAEPAAKKEPGAGKRSREDAKAQKRREAELRRRKAELVGPIAKRIETLEARISELEEAQKVRSGELSDPDVYADAARRNQLLDKFQKAQAKLEELTLRWEAASEELEEAESKLADEGG